MFLNRFLPWLITDMMHLDQGCTLAGCLDIMVIASAGLLLVIV